MSELSRYFDYAAATPLLPSVLEAMEPFLADRFYNASALYLAAHDNRRAIDDARHLIAQGIGAKPTEVVFTAGGTEANNLAIRGVLENRPGKNLVVSAIEHESVLRPAALYPVKTAPVNNKGIIDVAALTGLIDDDTVLVSLIYANNEIGTIQPLKDVKALLDDIRKDRKSRGVATPVYFHTDACQASNYLDMQVARLGVDLMTINAGKIYGPKQCGALYVASGVRLKPIILGGGQERNLRSGTENIANIVGFAHAWSQVRSDYQGEARRVAVLRDKLQATITENIPTAGVNGNASHRLANNLSLTFNGQDNERLLMLLDERGFQIATGSACSASHEEPSHVLKAVGLTNGEAHGTLRITLGRFTTPESAAGLAQAITEVFAV